MCVVDACACHLRRHKPYRGGGPCTTVCPVHPGSGPPPPPSRCPPCPWPAGSSRRSSSSRRAPGGTAGACRPRSSSGSTPGSRTAGLKGWGCSSTGARAHTREAGRAAGRGGGGERGAARAVGVRCSGDPHMAAQGLLLGSWRSEEEPEWDHACMRASPHTPWPASRQAGALCATASLTFVVKERLPAWPGGLVARGPKARQLPLQRLQPDRDGRAVRERQQCCVRRLLPSGPQPPPRCWTGGAGRTDPTTRATARFLWVWPRAEREFARCWWARSQRPTTPGSATAQAQPPTLAASSRSCRRPWARVKSAPAARRRTASALVGDMMAAGCPTTRRENGLVGDAPRCSVRAAAAGRNHLQLGWVRDTQTRVALALEVPGRSVVGCSTDGGLCVGEADGGFTVPTRALALCVCSRCPHGRAIWGAARDRTSRLFFLWLSPVISGPPQAQHAATCPTEPLIAEDSHAVRSHWSVKSCCVPSLPSSGQGCCVQVAGVVAATCDAATTYTAARCAIIIADGLPPPNHNVPNPSAPPCLSVAFH